MNKKIFLKTLFRCSLEFHALSHITSAESENDYRIFDRTFPKYIYVIYRFGRSVLEKYFVEFSKTALGRRPRDVFETETKYFSCTD